MENHVPQLLVARILVRESHQRYLREQIEAHRRDRETAGSRPARRDRIRFVIARALVIVGQRLAGNAETSLFAATGSDRTVRMPSPPVPEDAAHTQLGARHAARRQ